MFHDNHISVFQIRLVTADVCKSSKGNTESGREQNRALKYKHHVENSEKVAKRLVSIVDSAWEETFYVH